ncbi:hypothetical protein CCR95_06915 [Thiocystis minor]|uniref:Lcl C-terminal domain-containing protein n=1 Tax=Thiocystis minor TaxID=61597 RepID=UPI001912195B|nr:DUF1566 domain-containing protein [Thiocystis minor]MBK5963822.1 hypothetical protein [Thiocystis minor]
MSCWTRFKQARLLLALPLLISMSAVVPSCFAQTCLDDLPVMRPDSRFVANRDGTVIDRTTGLMWKQCTEGLSGVGCVVGDALPFKWKWAVRQGRDAVFAGYSDWRLPDQTELSSLLQRRCYGLDIDAVNFPNTPPDRFWSSTPSSYYPGSAWTLHFGHGAVDYGTRRDSAYVRLVRDHL